MKWPDKVPVATGNNSAVKCIGWWVVNVKGRQWGQFVNRFAGVHVVCTNHLNREYNRVIKELGYTEPTWMYE